MPSCLRYFPTAKAISHHIQQPQSACNNYQWTSGPLAISVACEQVNPTASRSSSPEPAVDAQALLDFHPELQDKLDESTDADSEENQYDFEPQPAIPALSSDDDELSWAVDFFDGAVVIHGAGQTFLMCFDLDQYSILHSQNLYYLFVNLDNWQMANSFLTSRLSMQEIAEFLSLNMVSCF